jgi:nucleotide-binding universal stress UspA family protein
VVLREDAAARVTRVLHRPSQHLTDWGIIMNDRTLTSRILLPLDGSELATIAIPYARALATPETELVLVRAVADPTPMNELAGTSAYPVGRILARNREQAEDYLGAVAEVLRDVAPTITTHAAIGEPPETILDAIQEHDATLVIVASHGRGFLGRVVVGSVADRIARAATVPVLVVHPTHHAQLPVHADSRARIDRLLVPLDGSAMARQALPVVESLGVQLDLPVHLIRALPTREEIAAHPDPVEHGYYEGMIAAAQDLLAAEAVHLRASGLTVTASSYIGPPAATILDEAGARDIVVMTSHGRGGVRRWLMGSVAERLIRAGEAPVLLVPVAERAALAEQASITTQV